jgi:hypothetical protein
MMIGSVTKCFAALGIAIVFVSVTSCRDNGNQRIRNLKLLRIALDNYYDNHGSYPDVDGKVSGGSVRQSWRMKIASELTTKNIPYDINAPWSSPVNSRAIDCMPPTLSLSLTEEGGITNYLAVTGAGSTWSAQSRAEYNGLPSDAICIVEIPDSNVIWTNPSDMSIAEFMTWWQSARTKYSHDPPFVMMRGGIERLSDSVVARIRNVHDRYIKQENDSNE